MAFQYFVRVRFHRDVPGLCFESQTSPSSPSDVLEIAQYFCSIPKKPINVLVYATDGQRTTGVPYGDLTQQGITEDTLNRFFEKELSE